MIHPHGSYNCLHCREPIFVFHTNDPREATLPNGIKPLDADAIVCPWCHSENEGWPQPVRVVKSKEKSE